MLTFLRTPLLAPYRRYLAWIMVFSFAINLLTISPAIYMIQVYERVLSSQSTMTLLFLTVIVLFIYFVIEGLDYFRQKILILITEQMDHDYHDELYQQAFNQMLDAGGRPPSESLQDLTTLRQFLASNAFTAFLDAPWAPIFVALAFAIHPLTGVFALACILLFLGITWVTDYLTKPHTTRANQYAIKSIQTADSQVRNAEVIGAMGMLEGVKAIWAQQHINAVRLQTLSSQRASTLGALTKWIRMSVQSLVLALGAWLVLQNQVGAGSVFAIMIIISRALGPAEQAINSWRQFVAAKSSLERLDQRLSGPASGPASDNLQLPAPTGHLKVEGISLYLPRTAEPVIHGLNMELTPGETLGIIGPSGSGKTTLARLLIGLLKPTQGAVRLDQADIAKWDKNHLGSYIGYLPQDVELMDGSVADNIARFGRHDDQAIVAAAKLAGVHDLILQLPNGYETPIGRQGHPLSGGQSQRIALARAVYGDPVLLVLDEPNSNLDESGEAALKDALLQLRAKQTTVIVITHRPAILEAVDKILILQGGRPAALGDRESVFAAFRQPAPTPQLPQEVAAASPTDERPHQPPPRANKQPDLRLLLRQIEEIAKRGAHQEAIDACLKLLNEFPDSQMETLPYLANVYVKARRFEEAVATQDKLLSGNPPKQAAFVYRDAALACRETNRHDRAIELINEALSHDHTANQHASLLIEKALTYRKMGEKAHAIESFMQAIELNPEQPVWVYSDLLRLLFALDMQDHAKQIIEKLPSHDKARNVIDIIKGLYFKLSGEKHKALEYYQKAQASEFPCPPWVLADLDHLRQAESA